VLYAVGKYKLKGGGHIALYFVYDACGAVLISEKIVVAEGSAFVVLAGESVCVAHGFVKTCCAFEGCVCEIYATIECWHIEAKPTRVRRERIEKGGITSDCHVVGVFEGEVATTLHFCE
jgi:hypothetical protein